MTIVNEEILQKILLTMRGSIFWAILAGFIVISYLLLCLMTWSFYKPLKYLGIPVIGTGTILLIIRFLPSIILNFFNFDAKIIKTLLPSLLKPVLIKGILCIVIGTGMIVIYGFINKKIKKNDSQQVNLPKQTN